MTWRPLKGRQVLHEVGERLFIKFTSTSKRVFDREPMENGVVVAAANAAREGRVDSRGTRVRPVSAAAIMLGMRGPTCR